MDDKNDVIADAIEKINKAISGDVVFKIVCDFDYSLGWIRDTDGEKIVVAIDEGSGVKIRSNGMTIEAERHGAFYDVSFSGVLTDRYKDSVKISPYEAIEKVADAMSDYANGKLDPLFKYEDIGEVEVECYKRTTLRCPIDTWVHTTVDGVPLPLYDKIKCAREIDVVTESECSIFSSGGAIFETTVKINDVIKQYEIAIPERASKKEAVSSVLRPFNDFVDKLPKVESGEKILVETEADDYTGKLIYCGMIIFKSK